MENKILFSIPGFTMDKYILNSILIKLFHQYQHYFYENIKIDSVFDSFKCVFTGGRNTEYLPNEKTMENLFLFFNLERIQIRNVCTNRIITKEHFNDYTSNMILNKLNEVGKGFGLNNGCTINNPELFNYIKEKYPNLQCIWSTTLEISDIDKINELSQDNLVIVSYNFNNKWELIDKLKHPNNIEFLCTEEGCVPNCPNRNKHTLLNSYLCLGKNPYKDERLKDFNCPMEAGSVNFYGSMITRPYYITKKLIDEEYLPRGFNKFKISGRSVNQNAIVNTIESYVNLMVKPENINFIRAQMLIDYLEVKLENKSI